MGLFSKDEKIPTVPPAPALPELPQPKTTGEKNLPELPSFPSNSQNENLNQQMVKSAVSEMPVPTAPHPEIPAVSEMPKPTDSMNSSEKMPSIADLPPIPTMPKSSEQPKPNTPILDGPNLQTLQPKPSLNEPIFVRLDKFQTSQKHLDSIKEKIAKVEITLKKIEEIKTKEEAELRGWMEDINQVKMKISEIDKDIFDQI